MWLPRERLQAKKRDGAWTVQRVCPTPSFKNQEYEEELAKKTAKKWSEK